jgi:hypothetical protein
MINDSDCHKYIPSETRFLIYDERWVDFRIWNADFGFKVFYLFYYWIERSDTTNPKSEI